MVLLRLSARALQTARASRATSSRASKADLFDETFSVAPMMDYTDRHFRYLFRLLSKRAALYTEMVDASAF